MIEDLDTIVNSKAYAPRHGWHDDHCAHDGTPAYLPAMMQVRSELDALLQICETRRLFVAALQLGLGPCDASHAVWRARFEEVVSIDFRDCLVNDERRLGAGTMSPAATRLAAEHGPYDLIFIDAGHTFEDARCDYLTYAPMIRPGGIVAFHDALQRDAYPEVEVWGFIRSLPNAQVIGDEVGIAWLCL